MFYLKCLRKNKLENQSVVICFQFVSLQEISFS